MIYVYYVIVIFWILLGIKITKNAINPLSIFNLIWLIVLFLYQFRLSYLQPELDPNTIILFILAVSTFSISFLLTYKIKYLDIWTENIKTYNNSIGYNFIKKNFYVWAIIEFIEIIYSRGVPIVWKLIGSSKTYFDFGIPTIHGFANAYGLVIIMLFYYYYMDLYINYKKKMPKCLLYIGIMLVFYLTLITRQVIISAVIQLFILNLFFVKRINYKKILLITIVGILSFGLVGNLRTGYDGFNRVALMKYNINPWLIGISWVYMYLTMTVSNINNVVRLGIKNFGIYPIAETYIPTVISRILFKGSKTAVPQYLVSQAFTVSGYFIHFYLGFGVLGTIIISVIFGIMSGIVLKKVTKNENEKNILYYSICMQILLLSFFYNHLLYLPSGFQYVIVYLIFKLYKLKETNKVEALKEWKD